ncbi:MAG: class I SAM-dependent methyltransferase [Waddliaceae bacterium]
MTENRLPIASVQKGERAKDRQEMQNHRGKTQARFERLWQRNPEQFNPMRNCMERERLERTIALIEQHVSLSGKLVVDLGCGAGRVSLRLKEKGATIHAVDVAKNALMLIKEKQLSEIKTLHDCLPATLLDDNIYDLVVCTDLIAYLPEKEHRLCLNELARLVKENGFVLCSTPIDIYSEDALTRFGALIDTELIVVDWKMSYHRCYLWLRNVIEAPTHFSQATKNRDFRSQALNQRQAFSRWWFKINSSIVLGNFWNLFQVLSKPIASFIRQSRIILLLLEKLSRLIWSDSGISHAIVIAKRRPLVESPPPPEFEPIERKQKKSVWE